MEVTKQLLAYYRDYFGVPYMLPKLDQLAIPGVRGGAMEDWGAISYNENVLLYDPEAISAPNSSNCLRVVAHEIAHQWFGDFVTAAWWDDIWLNEAFATWMENKTQAHFNPKWGSRVRERLSREEAFVLDAGKATRAVADPPAHESGIFEVFDEITYNKGGAVLGMFEAQVGEEVFREGLRRYMAAHRYSNATADDLWYHLSQASGTDLSPIIGGWIRQRGFPCVKVTTDCKDGRTGVDLSQERFISTRSSERATLWQVPVVVHAGGNTKRLILGLAPQHVDFPGCVPVVANGGDTGYYRVQYDAANLARLRAAYSDLPATERIGLVADTMALARSGRIEFAEYFRLLDALRDEREGAVWQQVIEEPWVPRRRLCRHAGAGICSRLRPISAATRHEPLGVAATAWRGCGNPSRTQQPDRYARPFRRCRRRPREAKAMFAAYTGTPSVPIEPSIRQGVVRVAARTADAETFETLRRLLKEASNRRTTTSLAER